jgi:hypothetical protein
MTKKAKRRAVSKAASKFEAVDKTTDAPAGTQVQAEGQQPEQPQAAPPPYQADTPEIPTPDDTSTDTTGNETASGVDADLETEAQIWALTECFKAIGRVAYNATGVKDALLDYKEPDAPPEQETDADVLAKAWAPLLPSMSPATQAIMVTVMILLPKALLVSSEMKKRKKSEQAALIDKDIKEAKNDQSSQ